MMPDPALLFAQRFKIAEGSLLRALRKLEHAQKGLEEERAQFALWEKKQHEALLLQANLFRIKRGMRTLTVNDWEQEGQERELELDPLLEPHEQLKMRFRRARKMRGGYEHLDLRRQKYQERIDQFKKRLEELASIQDLPTLQTFCQKYRIQLEPGVKQEEPQRLPYQVFRTQDGWEFWVGRSARDNDRLTFQFANGSDWWFHVVGMSGSHVVLKAQKDKIPPDPVLQWGAQLAIHHSKARHQGEAEVALTQCKYVRRLSKDKPGKVQISQQKLFFAHYNPLWRQLFK